MNAFMIEAYTNPHGGRTRRYYRMFDTAAAAANSFHQEFPDRVIRSVWSLVPPSYYTNNAGNPEGEQ